MTINGASVAPHVPNIRRNTAITYCGTSSIALLGIMEINTRIIPIVHTAIFIFCTLLAPKSSYACNGLQEPELLKLSKEAARFSSLQGDDINYLKYQQLPSLRQKEKSYYKAMAPVNFNDADHLQDLDTIGIVMAFPANSSVRFEGVGYKIGKRCVITAAHILYPTADQRVSPKNQEAYDGALRFIRGNGTLTKESSASIFFKMTSNGDYVVEGNARIFKGYSDFVILKLSDGDMAKRSLLPISPQTLLEGIDSRIGRRVNCTGFPSHMTEQKFGNCEGRAFFWEQRNVRAFAEDDSRYEFGIATNGAFSKGMSGGGCVIADSEKNELIGIAVNGYSVQENNIESMPDVEFVNQQYKLKHAKFIATFHELEKRMKAELGVGLGDIDKVCN